MSKQATAALHEPYRLLIDGTKREATDSETMPVLNPATGEHLTDVPAGDSEDIEQAVSSAGDAFEPWHRMSPTERGRSLNRLADRILEEEPR